MYGLDVNGIVNISQLHSGYYIAGNEVLQYHGGTPTPAISNIFVGITAGMHTIGSDNAFVGFEAGYDNTDGISNTAVGIEALCYDNGIYNTAIGYRALYYTTNTSFGFNTAVGNEAGKGNETGNNNTFIGNKTTSDLGNLQNASAIGANARVDESNCMVLGSIENINGAPQGSTVKVGIGTTTPQRRLEIQTS